MDLAAARRASIAAIEESGAEPVAWELITPRPVAPEDAWAEGVAASDSFVLLVGSAYGRRRQDGFAATHKEFLIAEQQGLERWVFVDGRVSPDDRDGHLRRWMDELANFYSYAEYQSEDELRTAIGRVLTDLARYRVYTWHKVGSLVIRADDSRLTAPGESWTGIRGAFEASGGISDPNIRGALAEVHAARRTTRLVVEGQMFDASPVEFEERGSRGEYQYRARYQLDPPWLNEAILSMTVSEAGREWGPQDLAELTMREILGLPTDRGPSMRSTLAPIDWSGLVAKAGRIPAVVQLLAELVAAERLLASGALSRVERIEARLVGPPAGVAVRADGTHSPGQGSPSRRLSVKGRIDLRQRSTEGRSP